ncbi:hypothetical protein COV24_03270 [candidate division WWE3 bacterium CG10_big_fil_rev_8_21_14_0_10_32_10]|uniref:MalT-like TPR region domain-containing protein n=1 Tax=candidate division WWE3 bacterium CG10_big_fil_rev_8_21_14_0_10_32_10 TaxID=1975090 RepID=A0A2H0R9X7_UNCKA|nr:MAG: hypothetical protein COV24_03270 [candidate division WWE3 bacterium CG10_big_fil_rev_8_21_14_0_10_32_10]
MENISDPKQLMEQGWKARENLEFEKAEQLLNTAKKMFEEQKDFYNISECLNHLSILKKMQGGILIQKSVELAEESLKINEEHNTKAILSHRALASSLKTLGAFEQAEKHINTVVEDMKENSAARADMRADLALNFLRRGNIQNATEQIELAKKELEEGWEAERMPHKMIWKTKILMYQSLVEYNKGNKEKSKEWAVEAQKLAKEYNLKTRLKETELLLSLF